MIYLSKARACSLGIEVVYPGHLSEGVVCFAFGALRGVDYIENALFVCPDFLVVFSAVAQPRLTKKVLSFVKAHSDVYLKPRLHGYFLGEYYVCHLVLDLAHREVLFFLWPGLSPYLDLVEALEILRL